MAPILITLTAKIINPFTIQPEITAAKFINVTLASFTLIAVYLLLCTIVSPLHSFLLTSLVATNQINLLYSVDVTNEIIYTFFLAFSLLLYQYQKKPFIYLLFGLLFLLRYESIVIPISVFIVEHYFKKPSLKLKNILFSFIPIFLWLIILNFHSRVGNSILGNAYIEEMINGLKNLPNTTVFSALIEIITFNPSFPSFMNNVFSLITIILCFYRITSSETKPIEKIVYLIFAFHLLFIFIFPNFAIRYYVPIIWILYFILSNHKSKIISFTVLLCLILYNFGRINIPTEYSKPKDMLEYRLASNWLNKTQFDKPTIVLIYEPHILRYYVSNINIFVPYDVETPFELCQEEITCICQNFLSTTSYKNILVITSGYSSSDYFMNNDKFTPILHHIKVFNDKIYQKNPYFAFVAQIVSDDGNNWANIWQYIPTK